MLSDLHDIHTIEAFDGFGLTSEPYILSHSIGFIEIQVYDS